MQSTSFGTLMIFWWLSLCASFTNFKNGKLEQTGDPTDGSHVNTHARSPAVQLFQSWILLTHRAVSSGRSHPCGCSARGMEEALAQRVSRRSADSRGMPWPRASPPAPFPVPFQPSPNLLSVPPLSLFACLVLMPFFPIARWISLCPHIFSLVLYLWGFCWFCPFLFVTCRSGQYSNTAWEQCQSVVQILFVHVAVDVCSRI